MKKNSKKGVSILEISIAIIIGLVIFTMTIPAYFRYIAKIKYLTSVREVISGFRSARSIAMTDNELSGCIIDPVNEAFYFPDASKLDGGTVTSVSSDTLTDSPKTWTNNAYIDYGVLIKTGSGKNKLFLISSNTSNQLISTGTNFATENVSVNDEYIIIPLLKRQYTSIDIVNAIIDGATYTSIKSIVFQENGSAVDSGDSYINSAINMQSIGITPALTTTISIIGTTGAIYK